MEIRRPTAPRGRGVFSRLEDRRARGARVWNAPIALLLALLLSLTSHHYATARTTPGPVGTIVLCTGSGTVTVPVDADGQPTAPRHLCPDCALVYVGQIAPPLDIPAHTPAARKLVVQPGPAYRLSARPAAAKARAPPLSARITQIS
ncbi:hypothetical protein [Poseidonocella sedimentorum]|uniref:DUF2946 domain-containing protein n=1 Tax=Poseidonocella sedimentorum TaxID=871652 RepID=A0A1I6EL85_9RHOB|nr:hypothetical protein [Poseidonocella sedimentorum]SFR18533.1 hypothetical protein SAMN04515673_11421 [Poseidonocella sedimentorum]